MWNHHRSIHPDVVSIWRSSVSSWSAVGDHWRCRCLDWMLTRLLLTIGMRWVRSQHFVSSMQPSHRLDEWSGWFHFEYLQEFPGLCRYNTYKFRFLALYSTFSYFYENFPTFYREFEYIHLSVKKIQPSLLKLCKIRVMIAVPLRIPYTPIWILCNLQEIDFLKEKWINDERTVWTYFILAQPFIGGVSCALLMHEGIICHLLNTQRENIWSYCYYNYMWTQLLTWCALCLLNYAEICPSWQWKRSRFGYL